MKPTLAFWIETLTVPMLAGGLVFGLAAVLAARCQSGRRLGAVWLAAFATLGLFSLGFWIGRRTLAQATRIRFRGAGGSFQPPLQQF